MSNQILELIDYKPSAAIRAMIEGLLEQSKNPDFEIDMTVFGEVRDGICYGGASTCAVQKIFGSNFNKENIYSRAKRASFLNISEKDLGVFEQAMSNLRQGRFYLFISMFEFTDHVKDNIINIIFSTISTNFWMKSNNWKCHISDLEVLILELENAGY